MHGVETLLSVACQTRVKDGELERHYQQVDSTFHRLWVSKMSAWWMMVIGGICALQIGSLQRLGNQDMAAHVINASQGVDLREDGSSS